MDDEAKKQKEEHLRRAIDWTNDKDMEALRFQDFRELKAGRDEFSKLRLLALQERVSIEVRERANEEFADQPRLIAQVYRWKLRGLNLDKAIRKVATDKEVSQNAARAKSKK